MKGIILCVILIITSSLNGQDSTYDSLFFRGSTGLRLPYRALQPAHQEADKKYPLVLFLHGAGERGGDNRLQLIHGANLFADPAKRSQFPAFILFPQCRAESFWSPVKVDRSNQNDRFHYNYDRPMSQDLSTVMELVKHYLKEYPVDKNRIYVTGLSMGGMGAFELVYRHPKCFAAALPICSGGDTGAYTKKSKGTKFWIFHGDSDSVVPVKGSRDMEKRLKDLGHEVKYTEYPGVNHNSWDSAFSEPGFLEWIFAQER